MNPNIFKIFLIIFTTVVIAISYNHFNPNRLDLIRKERILNWESDSLASFDKIDSLIVENALLDSKQIIDSDVKKKEKALVEASREPKAIKLDYAYKLFDQGIQFIDARSPEEFAEGHVKGAINIPFYGSENYASVIAKLNKNNLVVTYCESEECDISILSGDELFEMGFKKVYVFIGGYDEWIKNSYPITKKIN